MKLMNVKSKTRKIGGGTYEINDSKPDPLSSILNQVDKEIKSGTYNWINNGHDGKYDFKGDNNGRSQDNYESYFEGNEYTYNGHKIDADNFGNFVFGYALRRAWEEGNPVTTEDFGLGVGDFDAFVRFGKKDDPIDKRWVSRGFRHPQSGNSK